MDGCPLLAWATACVLHTNITRMPSFFILTLWAQEMQLPLPSHLPLPNKPNDRHVELRTTCSVRKDRRRGRVLQVLAQRTRTRIWLLIWVLGILGPTNLESWWKDPNCSSADPIICCLERHTRSTLAATVFSTTPSAARRPTDTCLYLGTEFVARADVISV